MANNEDVIITLHDKPIGYAENVTGGGTDPSNAIIVNNTDTLEDAVKGNNPKIVLVEPGTYKTMLKPGCNKTIIGLRPGVKIKGGIEFHGSGRGNIIIRNLAIRGNKCNSYDECKQGDDAFSIKDKAKLIWLDHLDIANGQDGNLDYTRASDLLTCTWCKFHYTYDKEHRNCNLIAGSDKETESRGKLRVTYQFCKFGDKIKSRQPRGRFGKVHMLNCYHKNKGSIYGVGREMSLIAMSCYYDIPGRPVFYSMGENNSWLGLGNKGISEKLNDKYGDVFDIPYEYCVVPATKAKEEILKEHGGAGNTCIFESVNLINKL